MTGAIPDNGGYETIVAGAGAAGIAAALAAARCGRKVLLIEREDAIGGTVAHTFIHTIGGLYDSKGEPLHPGLPTELEERLTRADQHVRRRRIGKTWVLNADPAHYLETVTHWLSEEKNITVLCSAHIHEVQTHGEAVTGLRLRRNGQTAAINDLRSLIDTTGSAQIVRLAMPEKARTPAHMAASGLIVQVKGTQPDALAFPRGAAIHRAVTEATAQGRLPSGCTQVWMDTGVYPDECYIKLFVPAATQDALQRAYEARDSLLAYLKEEFPGFSNATAGRTGRLGIRDGGEVEGMHYLTADEVRAGKKFPDAACRGAWPIEYWDTAKPGLTLEYLADDLQYDIPLGALAVAGTTNLWVAGKCISADPLARASTRVAGTCWAMGEAAGNAAGEKRYNA